MKIFDKVRVTTCALIVGVMGSFAGAITSTLAWYAYSTTASVAYKGTSIGQSEQLQVGIKTDLEFSEEMITQYGMEFETVGDDKYVFMTPGTGLDSEIISYYLTQKGYASNELMPTTSQKYTPGDDLKLKQHLWALNERNDAAATKKMYSEIPLAFRVCRGDDIETRTYVKKQQVWLSAADAMADGAGEVYKAVRVHFDGDEKFIFNPSATGTNKATKVGGVLDLNGDGYFDTDSIGFAGGKEIFYGGYDGDLPTPVLCDEDSDLVDINGTGNDSAHTTFTASHEASMYCYNDISDVKVHKAQYYTIDEMKPESDYIGHLSGGHVLCTTSDDEYAIADLTMTVYLEGWDHSVIDAEINHKFALGLTFEINRVS